MSPGFHQTSSIPRSYQLINDFTVGHGHERLRRLEHHDIHIWHLYEAERYKRKTKFVTKVSPQKPWCLRWSTTLGSWWHTCRMTSRASPRFLAWNQSILQATVRWHWCTFALVHSQNNKRSDASWLPSDVCRGEVNAKASTYISFHPAIIFLTNTNYNNHYISLPYSLCCSNHFYVHDQLVMYKTATMQPLWILQRGQHTGRCWSADIRLGCALMNKLGSSPGEWALSLRILRIIRVFSTIFIPSSRAGVIRVELPAEPMPLLLILWCTA